MHNTTLLVGDHNTPPPQHALDGATDAHGGTHIELELLEVRLCSQIHTVVYRGNSSSTAQKLHSRVCSKNSLREKASRQFGADTIPSGYCC